MMEVSTRLHNEIRGCVVSTKPPALPFPLPFGVRLNPGFRVIVASSEFEVDCFPSSWVPRPRGEGGNSDLSS